MVKRIYLDYAASTPVDPKVLRVMLPYLSKNFGNPGSLHSFGQTAITAVDRSREIISKFLDVDFREVIFTGSATEANNLAIRGAVDMFRKRFPDKTPQIILSSIEHESVLETAKDLEKNGARVVYLPVNKEGVVKVDALKGSLSIDTAVVSIMYVNNEVGSVQSIQNISKLVKDFRGSSTFPIFHTDAAQALTYFDCRPKELGVDLMTLSAQKIHGPKGVGALYISKDQKLSSMLTGGGQEFDLRSSTENVPGIAGFGKAIDLLDREKDFRHVEALRERFITGLKKSIPQIKLNSTIGSPHIVSVRFPGYSAEDMLVRLDLLGLAVSSGSACRSRSFLPSYVLKAMGLKEKEQKESLRISFSRMTTRDEIDVAVRIFKKVCSKQKS